MFAPLQENVQTGFVDAAGWIVLLGGLLLVAVWWHVLYR